MSLYPVRSKAIARRLLYLLEHKRGWREAKAVVNALPVSLHVWGRSTPRVRCIQAYQNTACLAKVESRNVLSTHKRPRNGLDVSLPTIGDSEQTSGRRDSCIPLTRASQRRFRESRRIWRLVVSARTLPNLVLLDASD